jgi:hypothetical protein
MTERCRSADLLAFAGPAAGLAKARCGQRATADRSAFMGSYARGGARGECWSTIGAAGIATSSLEGAGDVDGDQKSASIGVCASITANIGAAVTAEKATIAMQTMTTAVEREVTSPFYCTDSARQNASPTPVAHCHGARIRVGPRGRGRLGVLSTVALAPPSIVCSTGPPGHPRLST